MQCLFVSTSLRVSIIDLDVSLSTHVTSAHCSMGLDQQITTMIFSMTTPPDTIEVWIDKAKLFHGHKLRINDLRAGNYFNIFHPSSNSSQTNRDSNAMDIDFVMLKKLFPQEWAKCMREGRYFKCRKVGHDVKNCRSSLTYPNKICIPLRTPVQPNKLEWLKVFPQSPLLPTFQLVFESPV